MTGPDRDKLRAVHLLPPSAAMALATGPALPRHPPPPEPAAVPCHRHAPPHCPLTRWCPSSPPCTFCWAWRRSGAGRALTTVRGDDRVQANACCPLPEACVEQRCRQQLSSVRMSLALHNINRTESKVVRACHIAACPSERTMSDGNDASAPQGSHQAPGAGAGSMAAASVSPAPRNTPDVA